MPHSFVQAQTAAEIAVASMALRSYFARQCEDEPELVSLRIEVTASPAEHLGLLVAVEFIDSNGLAIGGLTL